MTGSAARIVSGVTNPPVDGLAGSRRGQLPSRVNPAVHRSRERTDDMENMCSS
jgi:hypothetical protein